MGTLANEDAAPVRDAITNIGVAIMGHDNDWIGQQIETHCKSPAIHIFATLAAAAPEHFQLYLEPICTMFSSALATIKIGDNTNETTSQLCTPASLCIMRAMGHLTPYILRGQDKMQKAILNEAISYIVDALQQSHPIQDSNQITQMFAILNTMADAEPKLLNDSLTSLIDYCFKLAVDNGLSNVGVWSYVTEFIKCVMQFHGKKITKKQERINKMFHVILMVLATAPVDGHWTMKAIAMMHTMVSSIPTYKMESAVIDIFPLALNDQRWKKAVHQTIGIIVEVCGASITCQTMKTLLHYSKIGMDNEDFNVQAAAIHNIGNFEAFNLLYLAGLEETPIKGLYAGIGDATDAADAADAVEETEETMLSNIMALTKQFIDNMKEVKANYAFNKKLNGLLDGLGSTLTCPECGKTFVTQQNIRKHIQGSCASIKYPSREQKQFACEDCTKTFATKHLLTQHARIHRKQSEDEPPQQKKMKRSGKPKVEN